jgi:predicted enzyme related to lactoylglutathione lyase
MKATLQSINLLTQHPGKLKDFYTSAFNLDVNEQRSHAPGFYVIGGGKGCNILIQDAQGQQLAPMFRGFELGFETDTLTGVIEAVIKAGGTVVNDTQQMGWGTAVTVADPDGNQINIYVFRRE